MASNVKKLRSGYTTGACAAAAAKGATNLLFSEGRQQAGNVEIPFPDGSRVMFKVHSYGFSFGEVSAGSAGTVARASILKDAGDDPDVTNGAEIAAEARWIRRLPGIDECTSPLVVIKGGKGVGKMTKPGLPVPVGEPAINPVPRTMINHAVNEAISEFGELPPDRLIEITISVPQGEELAKKTLNPRLGILGGISILGTTGIVRPLSTEAWTCSIEAALNVAAASGLKEVVLSVGRISEAAHMKKYRMPEEAYIMMGDYLEFSLLQARRHNFEKIHISAHWAKMLKISMSTPQTHVRHGAMDIKKAVTHLNALGIAVPQERDFNTAREIYDYLTSEYGNCLPLFRKVCIAVKQYAEGMTAGIPVASHLVSYQKDIITDSE